MKIRIAFLSLMAASTSLVAVAQVEHDDMYFKSKDRSRLQASKPMTLKSMSSEHEIATSINPTDSYSARNVNPEYISQNKVGSGTSEPAPYFIPDYTPTAVNQNLATNNPSYWNNNMGMAGYNPYSYRGMYSAYANPYSSFYSPMYGYGYDPFGYNGYNSFNNSGWSSFLTLGFGMGGYNPYGGWGSPYYGWNSFYNMGGYGYYPGNVIIINNDYYGRNVVYGKRSSRSSDVNNYVNANNRSTAMATTTDSQGRVRSASGRISSEESTSNYYQRGWRTNPETNSAVRSNWSTSGRSGELDNSSGFRSNTNTRSSNSSFFDNSGSRSNYSSGSSNFSSGGGSRSSGSVSSGSSGARRGRD